MAHVLRLGLTGGIGSGKSTVAALLETHGTKLVDADAISRATSAAGGSAIDALTREFGTGFITPDGALDRDRMRQATFADPQVRIRLEAIIHPEVYRHIREWLASLPAGTPSMIRATLSLTCWKACQ